MGIHRLLAGDRCIPDVGDKVQGKSGVHRCHGQTCVVEISQHPLFVGNTGAMHVQSLVGLEAPVILDVLQSLCIVLQHLNGDEQANRQDLSLIHI